MMASMGSTAGERITRAFETALKRDCPSSSSLPVGCARMQEGMLSFDADGQTAGAPSAKRRRPLYVTVLTDPTTGGSPPALPPLGTSSLAEPGPSSGFRGERGHRRDHQAKAAGGFPIGGVLRSHGFVDEIVSRGSCAMRWATCWPCTGEVREDDHMGPD